MLGAFGVGAAADAAAGTVLANDADDRAAPVAEARLAVPAAVPPPGLSGLCQPPSTKTETEAGEPAQNVAARRRASEGLLEASYVMFAHELPLSRETRRIDTTARRRHLSSNDAATCSGCQSKKLMTSAHGQNYAFALPIQRKQEGRSECVYAGGKRFRPAAQARERF